MDFENAVRPSKMLSTPGTQIPELFRIRLFHMLLDSLFLF